MKRSEGKSFRLRDFYNLVVDKESSGGCAASRIEDQTNFFFFLSVVDQSEVALIGDSVVSPQLSHPGEGLLSDRSDGDVERVLPDPIGAVHLLNGGRIETSRMNVALLEQIVQDQRLALAFAGYEGELDRVPFHEG